MEENKKARKRTKNKNKKLNYGDGDGDGDMYFEWSGEVVPSQYTCAN